MTCFGEDTEWLESFCVASGNINWCNYCQFLKKLIIELPNDPDFPLLGIYLKEIKARSQTEYAPIQYSISHNSAKLEATVFINKWMDKQNVVSTYNRILFSLKMEGKCDSSDNMNEPWKHTW